MKHCFPAVVAGCTWFQNLKDNTDQQHYTCLPVFSSVLCWNPFEPPGLNVWDLGNKTMQCFRKMFIFHIPKAEQLEHQDKSTKSSLTFDWKTETQYSIKHFFAFRPATVPKQQSLRCLWVKSTDFSPTWSMYSQKVLSSGSNRVRRRTVWRSHELLLTPGCLRQMWCGGWKRRKKRWRPLRN